MSDGYCDMCAQTPCACDETVTVSKAALLHLVRKMDLDTERDVYPRFEVDLATLKGVFSASELRSGDVIVPDEHENAPDAGPNFSRDHEPENEPSDEGPEA
jgi:hypothetical protein